MSLAVESGMALNCCAFSVSSSTGVCGSVAVARQLCGGGGNGRGGVGRCLCCQCIVNFVKSSSSSSINSRRSSVRRPLFPAS